MITCPLSGLSHGQTVCPTRFAKHVFEVMFDRENGVFGWQTRLANGLKEVWGLATWLSLTLMGGANKFSCHRKLLKLRMLEPSMNSCLIFLEISIVSKHNASNTPRFPTWLLLCIIFK